MPQTRITEWLARLPQQGPWWASVVLVVLIAVELARAAVVLWGAGPVQPLLPPHPAGAHATQDSGVDIANIISAHLFGVAEVRTQSEDSARESTANLVLNGTIATEDPKHGVAIISDGGPGKVYSVGNNVGGASLYSVYLDHVILDRAGTLETLKLPRLQLTGREPGVRRQIGAQGNVATNLENVRRMVQADPGLLGEIMRAVPSFDNKANKLRGFRVYPGRNRSAFANLGLRPGDLVTAINGTPLDDPQHGQEIFNTIQSSATAAVTVERGGQNVELSLNVAQVLSEATRDLSSAPPASTPPGPAPTNNALTGPQTAPSEPAAAAEQAPPPAAAPAPQPSADPASATEPPTTNP
jgi:general secretion pathway protein C